MFNKKLNLSLIIMSIMMLTFISCNDDDNDSKTDKDAESSLTDADGNSYKTVTIGNQVWMAENLRTTVYNGGSPIQTIKTDGEWVKQRAEALYCWYKNDSADAISKKYGALYNYDAVKSGKLCPKGWHIPTGDDWTVLNDYIAANGYGDSVAVALKSTSGWKDDANGDDHYKFSAVPSPARFGLSGDGAFSTSTDGSVYWWYDIGRQYYLGYGFNSLKQGYNDTDRGYCVRCLKDLKEPVHKVST